MDFHRGSAPGCRWISSSISNSAPRAAGGDGAVFNQAVAAMVGAFLKRARTVYGHPAATVAVMPVPAKT